MSILQWLRNKISLWNKKILKSLKKEDLDKYLKNQLKALDREIYLLEIERPKFILMSSVFDVFSYAFNNLVNEKEFPHIFKGEIVDKPTSYGAPLNNAQFNLISIFLKNIDQKSYPKFMINYLEKNYKIIENLIKIDNKAFAMTILYSSLDLSYNLSKESFTYIKNVEIKHKTLINKIKSSFSRDIIREIIKNLPNLLTKDKCRINKRNLYFYEKIFSPKGSQLINVDNDLDLLIDLLKLENVRKASFLAGDRKRIDSFIFLNLFEKSLKFSGGVRVLNNSLASIKDLKFDKFISRICKENISRVEKILSNNKFNTSILFVSYQEFINEKNKGTFRKLAKKYNIYEIINCNNKEVFLKLGKKSNEIIYKFYDKDFKLFVEKKLPQNFIYDLKFLQLNLLKTEKFYKFEEFITLIRRGYSMAELLNSGAKYSKEGISYITNSNISRGFLDKSQAKLSFVKENLTLVKKDDLVISKSPPYKIALIEDDKQYLANDNLFIIKIDKNKIDSAYIWSYLQSKKAQKIIIKNQKDTKNLSIKMLKNMEITIYDSEKMGKIRCEFLKNINILKNSYKKIEDISKTNEEIFE